MAIKTPITELDFFQVKEQLKTFLRGQTQFKDYDFEGSNMSVLLDVLAYNTYQNNFYTNMAFSEMFLDSATLENSVMSHAKTLNYLPHSTISAVAKITVTITSASTIGSTYVIPKYTKFTSNYNGLTYNFYTNQTYLAVRQGTSNNFVASCIDIYEGDYISEVFYLRNSNDKLELSNKTIDISSLSVFLNNGSEEYTFKSDIFGVSNLDKIYYIEPSYSGTYYVEFGQNIFGYQPTSSEDITVSYRISSGSKVNGANKFTTSLGLPVSILTVSAASGGSEKETIEQIKYFAPKSIQTQERAVTTRDYEILLKKQFSSIIKSISVYGGDELDPPHYGSVAVSINPYSGLVVSDSLKSQILNYLTDKTPVAIKPVFVETDFLYGKLDITATYSLKNTTKTATELQSLILSKILEYSNVELNDFGKSLYISKLSSEIDNLDISILNNTIQASPIIDYSPSLNVFLNPTFKFSMNLNIPYAFNNSNMKNYIPSIKSSVFTYDNVDSYFQDDGNGKIMILSNSVDNSVVLSPNAGTIDYSTGTLKLSNFKVSSYAGNAIKIYANQIDKNIVSPKTRIFYLRTEDITINVLGQ